MKDGITVERKTVIIFGDVFRISSASLHYYIKNLAKDNNVLHVSYNKYTKFSYINSIVKETTDKPQITHHKNHIEYQIQFPAFAKREKDLISRYWSYKLEKRIIENIKIIINDEFSVTNSLIFLDFNCGIDLKKFKEAFPLAKIVIHTNALLPLTGKLGDSFQQQTLNDIRYITESKDLFHKFRNDFDLTFFTPAIDDCFLQQNVEKHDFLNHLTKPIICYIGLISHELLDYNLLKQLAIDEPIWTFLLLGPISKRESNNELLRLPNIKIVEFNWEEISSYVPYADIFIFPINNNLNKFQKIPFLQELTFSGKPIIASKGCRITEDNIIKVSDDPCEWKEYIKQYQLSIAIKRSVRKVVHNEDEIPSPKLETTHFNWNKFLEEILS